jgi:hypothetical protein
MSVPGEHQSTKGRGCSNGILRLTPSLSSEISPGPKKGLPRPHLAFVRRFSSVILRVGRGKGEALTHRTAVGSRPRRPQTANTAAEVMQGRLGRAIEQAKSN